VGGDDLAEHRRIEERDPSQVKDEHAGLEGLGPLDRPADLTGPGQVEVAVHREDGDPVTLTFELL
jgi:hypothetical protein